MAKSTKPKAAETKKAETVIETPKEEKVQAAAMAAEPKDSLATIIETAKEGDTPLSVTLDEVNDIIPVPQGPFTVLEKPEVWGYNDNGERFQLSQEQIAEIPHFKNTAFLDEKFNVIPETMVEEVSETPFEERVLNFLKTKDAGEIKMNDFLKSLFGVAKFGEPPLWQNQGATKQIKVLLEKLHNAGEIEVCGNAHLKLGTTYYPDTTTMRAAQYDLGSVPIFCKKVN